MYVCYVCHFQPWSNWLDLTKSNQRKFSESAWRAVYYGFTSFYGSYLLIFSGRYSCFFHSKEIWTGNKKNTTINDKESYRNFAHFLDWAPCESTPYDVYIIYMVQFGFYVHAIYATLYLDQWRKDSLVMIFHHLICICLLVFSFIPR